MKGFVPGELALVINARTNHGKKFIVGKTVTLLQQFKPSDCTNNQWIGTLVIDQSKEYNIGRVLQNLWLVRCDGFPRNPEIPLELPDGYAIIAEIHLLKLDSDDDLIEEFKREQTNNLTCGEFEALFKNR